MFSDLVCQCEAPRTVLHPQTHPNTSDHDLPHLVLERGTPLSMLFPHGLLAWLVMHFQFGDSVLPEYPLHHQILLDISP